MLRREWFVRYGVVQTQFVAVLSAVACVGLLAVEFAQAADEVPCSARDWTVNGTTWHIPAWTCDEGEECAVVTTFDENGNPNGAYGTCIEEQPVVPGDPREPAQPGH